MAVVYLVLSVLRSDARALSGYLRSGAGPLLAEGFEADVFHVVAARARAPSTSASRARARAARLKATLEGVAANLRLEMRRAFEHDFPAPDVAPSLEELRASVQRLAAEPAARAAERGPVPRALARRTPRRARRLRRRGGAAVLSERLRRDVWMFAQIVRAFAVKARAVNAEGAGAMGGRLAARVRARVPGLLPRDGLPAAARGGLPARRRVPGGDGEPAETPTCSTRRASRSAVDEAEQFHGFLTELFEAIGRRDELADVPFDRRAAAEALKLYLGD